MHSCVSVDILAGHGQVDDREALIALADTKSILFTERLGGIISLFCLFCHRLQQETGYQAGG